MNGVNPHAQKAEEDSILSELQKVVNSQDILQELDKESFIARYPRSHYDSLTQRCYTYVPGSSVYPPQTQSQVRDPIMFMLC